MDDRNVEVVFNGLPESDAIKDAVSRFAVRLGNGPPTMARFQVCLTCGNPDAEASSTYYVHIEADVSGRKICIDKASEIDVYVALLNALKAMEAKVQDSRRKGA